MLRAESKLDPKQQVEGTLYSRASALEIACKHVDAIHKLANVRLTFQSGAAAGPSAAMRST